MDNQKIGWKGVFVYHESNGEARHLTVRALAPRHIHLRNNGADTKSFLLAYYDDKGQRGDITNEDVRKQALKVVATVLEYPTAKGIPIDRIDTHSLRSGGANALSLSGFLDTQIQNKGTVARRYVQRIHPRRAVCVGMSKSMKKKFNVINIAGNAFNTITNDMINREYEVNVSAASAA